MRVKQAVVMSIAIERDVPATENVVVAQADFWLRRLGFTVTDIRVTIKNVDVFTDDEKVDGAH